MRQNKITMRHGNFMIKILWLTVIFLIMGLVILINQSEGKSQLWKTVSIEKPLKESWSVKIEEHFRTGNRFRKIEYQSSDIGLTYRRNDRLNFSFNYAYIFRFQNGAWEEEVRPHLNGTISGQWLGLDWSNRNRFEYRIRTHTKDTIRYRNKSRIDMPVKWTRHEISPYIAEEVFVDFDQDNFDQNRLESGLGFSLTKNTKGEIYYLWQSEKSKNDWENDNIIGINVIFEF